MARKGRRLKRSSLYLLFTFASINTLAMDKERDRINGHRHEERGQWPWSLVLSPTPSPFSISFHHRFNPSFHSFHSLFECSFSWLPTFWCVSWSNFIFHVQQLFPLLLSLFPSEIGPIKVVLLRELEKEGIRAIIEPVSDCSLLIIHFH